MAEILVKVQDSYVPGESDAKLVSRQGSPVTVRPDGFRWGKKECLPTFCIFHVYDRDWTDLQFLTDAKITYEDLILISELGDVVYGQKPEVAQKFVWRINIQDMLERIERKGGFVRMSWNELQSRLTGSE